MVRTLVLRSWGAWLAGAPLACVGPPPGPPAGGTRGSSSAGEEGDGSDGSGGTASLYTARPEASSSGEVTTGDASSTGPTAAGSTTSGDEGSCEPPGSVALGGECQAVCDCHSEQCFEIGVLGGVCSECDEDADCARRTGFGCNAGNPLSGVPAVCSSTGAPGEGCQSRGACAEGLWCPPLFEIPGILDIRTCSLCGSDEDCADGRLCAPSYDVSELSGSQSCVTPGTVPNGEGCAAGRSGDAQCESGRCVGAAVGGMRLLDVCSPCRADADCPDGLLCRLPSVEFDGGTLALVPGSCG